MASFPQVSLTRGDGVSRVVGERCRLVDDLEFIPLSLPWLTADRCDDRCWRGFRLFLEMKVVEGWPRLS